MRKLGILLIALLLVGMLAPGLIYAQDGGDGEETETPTPPEPWVCPEGFEGQELHVYNWSTYVAEDTIPNFEAACGVTVVYDIFGSNEEMLARLREGNPGYDIIVPSDYAVASLIADELLVPLDHEMIPNMANLTTDLTDAPFDPGNQYSVPYQWGTIGLGYNITEVGEEITSWQQVWDYEGNVAWLEDPRSMVGIGLNFLGYDPNSSDEDEIAEATEFLIESGSNVVAIAADDGQVLLERGDVDITVEYSGDIFQVIADCECEDYRYVIPEEGSVVWMDNLAIPKDAPNVELAHAFIDYILHPQVGADISNYTAYASPNQAAIDLGLIDEEYLSNTSIYPDEEVMSNLFWIEENPENEELVLDAWDEIVIFAGAE
jgi:spermidine/putrescine transport system substrate-binding protein